MMLPAVATLLAVASLAAGQITMTTYTIENCFTAYERGPVNITSVPTSVTVRTATGNGFARGIITPVVTVTPAISTETTTSVSTNTVRFTAPTEALTSGITTVTTTFTISSIISSISTFTSVVSVNSTITNTPTTTIPTQAGFTPVSVDLASWGHVPSRKKQKQKKRWGALNARNVFDRMMLEAPEASRGSNNRCLFKHLEAQSPLETGISLYPPLFPVSVNCTQTVRIDTVRVYPKQGTITSTITAQASTTTSTATSAVTTTTTIGSQRVNALLTFTSAVTTVVSSTTISVSTTFSTLTNTFTANAPVATVFAACAANNTISRVNGNPIAAGAQDLLVLTVADNPTDCCELCQITSNCTTSAFYDGTGDCMLGNGTGPGTNEFFTTDAEDDIIFYISNGKGNPSGNWYFGGLLS
ncbi:uncharacterized protein LTHEOB_12258 [Lasiodiplodia theobromae]|uniref:uncharacterized protein n=1 Tax=Lasiodiplodia theobromae TaxID=45133 RepID=UPI0015C319BC|nr:uncharacterized protein LTHEOB_12258 [Lasiodiplodia theobromae]KAF4536062.1 hypothetical protein LTHEOB_12258 [Lasiodiplodia theobromae]